MILVVQEKLSFLEGMPMELCAKEGDVYPFLGGASIRTPKINFYGESWLHCAVLWTAGQGQQVLGIQESHQESDLCPQC